MVEGEERRHFAQISQVQATDTVETATRMIE